jgi:hypothetical protein
MNAHEDVETGNRFGWFLRAAGAIGDLSSPFYREERQRDVWNEASAVGLQVTLLLALAAATGMVWLGGAAALPYAFTVLGVVGVASWMTLLYAAALGVTVDDASLLRLRLVPYLALMVLFLVGAARVAPSGGFVGGLVQGGIWGAAAGGALAVVLTLRAGLRARRRPNPEG